MPEARTRIAPSPTGDPHVGTAYIALFNLCFARRQGGSFILRIEDTDEARGAQKHEDEILSALRWLGLDWDEGPDKGGEQGPYRQSERLSIYQEYASQLLEQGQAFRCFCSEERLAELRRRQMAEKRQPGYDGHCLNLSEKELEAQQDGGEKCALRMKKPAQGACEVKDLLRGSVSIDWRQVDMQVLMKADGRPTYHLASVVDDHLMRITHVIRGEEWLNSTPKHLLLYGYFGWEPPQFLHMPLLRNPDKSKLSKRKNPTSLGYYQRMGYLPEALLNYLGTLGWSMPDGEELFTLAEMIANFDIERVSLGGPVFDADKLNWLNGRYLREKLSDEDFVRRYAEWAFQPQKVRQAAPLIKPRVNRFSEVMPLAGFFLSGLPQLGPSSFAHKKLSQEDSLKILQFSLWSLEQLEEWQRDAIQADLTRLASALEMPVRNFLFPLFVAISGASVSVSVIDAMAIIGLDLTRERLRSALTALGGVSKRKARELEKEYRLLSAAPKSA